MFQVIQSHLLPSSFLYQVQEKNTLHEVIIKKDYEIVKAKGERKSLALKAKKESNDEDCLTSRSEDKEYVMEVKDFKKFFKRRGRFVRQPRNDKKTFQRSRDDKNGKSDRKCFRCGDPNHLIGKCSKPPKDKNQRAFVGGSWSDSGEEDDQKANDETCLVVQASSEVCSESSYLSDENSSIGYSQNSKAYIILNKHTMEIKEPLNVTLNETTSPSKTLPLVDDDLDEEEAIKVTKKNLENDIEGKTLEIDDVVNIKEYRNHLLENVIRNLNQRTLRSQAQNQIPQLKNMTIIGTKWAYRNKLDENDVVSRNKARFKLALEDPCNLFVKEGLPQLPSLPQELLLMSLISLHLPALV
nr:retrotransposon-related protein [Tanacetum cinerariifolium]